MFKVLVLHGPNLNMLGIRQPEIYGTITLAQINENLTALAQQNNIVLECKQSNHEGVLIDWIHQAYEAVDLIIFNPAGLTHTSIVLSEALLAVNIPFIEVHLSDINEREAFRKVSYFEIKTRIRIIKGAGAKGYEDALLFAKEYLLHKLKNIKFSAKL